LWCSGKEGKKTRRASLVGGKSVLLLTCPSGHGKRNTVREDPGESDGSVRRLANKLFPPQKERILLVTTSPLSSLTSRGKVGTPSPRPSSSLFYHFNMTMRSSPLKPRKNNAKRSAKPSAAVQRRVSDLEDCSAAIAEGIHLAAPPAAASAPAPAPAPVPSAPGAQLPAAIEGGFLTAAGRFRARLSGEAPLDDGRANASMDALMEPPRARAPAPPVPAPASAPVPGSRVRPRSRLRPPLAPAATRTAYTFYNWWV
jgi:hypothetical protein